MVKVVVEGIMKQRRSNNEHAVISKTAKIPLDKCLEAQIFEMLNNVGHEQHAVAIVVLVNFLRTVALKALSPDLRSQRGIDLNTCQIGETHFPHQQQITSITASHIKYRRPLLNFEWVMHDSGCRAVGVKGGRSPA